MRAFLFYLLFQAGAFSGALAQTSIKVILKECNLKGVEQVMAFDLSQKESYEVPYKDTVEFHFNKSTVDCYNIRYTAGGKLYRQQLWLDSGSITIIARLDSAGLTIDTVLNAPVFQLHQQLSAEVKRFYKSKDTAGINKFLLGVYGANINNPYSLLVADVYLGINQNSKKDLLILKEFLDRQGGLFSWFILYPSVNEKLTQILLVTSISFKDLLLKDIRNRKAQIQLKDASFYVLDFWFLACPPCIKDHNEIKKFQEKLQRNKIEMISISIDDDHKAWKDYLVEHQYNWTNFREDERAPFTDKMGISSFPTYIVLDSKSNIVGYYNSFEGVLQRFGIDEIK
jgi:thiol-disulfide isomerase/thioredoxin